VSPRIVGRDLDEDEAAIVALRRQGRASEDGHDAQAEHEGEQDDEDAHHDTPPD